MWLNGVTARVTLEVKHLLRYENVAAGGPKAQLALRDLLNFLAHQLTSRDITDEELQRIMSGEVPAFEQFLESLASEQSTPTGPTVSPQHQRPPSNTHLSTPDERN